MRKKVGNEDGVLNNGGRREKEEGMHRKAAALAWFKHGRKGSTLLGSKNVGSKMQNPLLHAPRRARRHQDSSEGASDEESIAEMLAAPPCVDTPYHHHHHLQASRFKAEALALQNSPPSPSSSSATTSTYSSTAITTTPHKQHLINMTTGHSLALLSLLPHQQSQKCFNNGYPGRSTAIDPLNSATTPWDCGSSLYDSFELLCLSNQLGRCLTTVNAATTTAGSSSSSSSSSYSKFIKNLTANPLQGPSLQPSYIPRSLYSLPQFMIPNYLATKSSKKRSSLIHPIFSSPNTTSSTSSPCLPAPPLSSSPLHTPSTKSQSAADDHATRKKAESGGFRRVFNSLLKSLHMKEDPAQQKPKRSNLSEELEKLPKNRPASSSRGALKYEDPAAAMALSRSPNSYSSGCGAEMESKRSMTSSGNGAAMEGRRSFSSSSPATSSSSSSSGASAGSMSARRASTSASSATYHFRNEGFRTTYRPPKSVKWVPPSN